MVREVKGSFSIISGKIALTSSIVSLSSIASTSHGKGFLNFSSVCKTLFKVSGQSLKLGRIRTVKLVRGETKESWVGLMQYGETRNKIRQNPGETPPLHPRSPLHLEETQNLSVKVFLQVYTPVAFFFFFNCKIPGRLAPLGDP